MTRPIRLGVLLSWGALIAPATAQPTGDDWLIETHEWSQEIPPGLQIAIDNPFGGVRIHAFDGQGFEMTAVSQRHRDDPRPIELEPVREEGRYLLAVRMPPDERDTGAPADWRRRRVDLTVQAPASSPLSVRTTSGAVDVALSAPHWRHAVEIETVTGDIDIQAPPDADLAIEIDTQGEIASDYSLAVERMGYLRKRARAALGEAAAALRATSHQGNVVLREQAMDEPPARQAMDEPSAPISRPSMEEWRIERVERVIPLPPGQAFEVENLHGNVLIRANDRPEVLVVAQAQRHREDARPMELAVEAGAGRTRLAVREPPADAAAPGGWGRRRVDISLLVPPAAALEVRTDRSLVEIKGHAGPVTARSQGGDLRLQVAGAVDLRTEAGSIGVTFRTEEWSHTSRLETALGDIEVAFPARSHAEVTLEGRGPFTSDYSLSIERLPGGRRRGSARLGRGGPQVNLASLQGRLKVLQLPELRR